MTKLGGGRGCLDAGTALGTTKAAPCVPVSCVDTERGGGAGVHAHVCTSVHMGGRMSACVHTHILHARPGDCIAYGKL